MRRKPRKSAGLTVIRGPDSQKVVVDGVYLDYLTSTAPAPSQLSLDAVLSETRRVRVLRGGSVSGRPLSTEVLFETGESEAVAALCKTLKIVEGPSGHCMCHGDPSIELLEASGKRLAVIGVHHGQGIRWDAWRDDAELVEGRSLLEWIAAQGASYPLETYEEDMRQREIAKADRIRWLEAMPACLKPFADQTKDGRAMLDALAEAHSDESEQVLVLLAWFGSGVGRWNGYPVYEQDAQDLLMTFPIEHLLTALDSSELIGARLEGAARFFASWDFRTKRGAELNRLPESVKRALLEHSLQSTDPDKRARAQKAFGWVM